MAPEILLQVNTTSARPTYTRNLDLVSVVSANDLAPRIAKQLSGIVIATKFD